MYYCRAPGARSRVFRPQHNGEDRPQHGREDWLPLVPSLRHGMLSLSSPPVRFGRSQFLISRLPCAKGTSMDPLNPAAGTTSWMLLVLSSMSMFPVRLQDALPCSCSDIIPHAPSHSRTNFIQAQAEEEICAAVGSGQAPLTRALLYKQLHSYLSRDDP
ncbi:hypothetical protein E1301_Tti012644 [Triplophysa tibetana]|uniref:Uncharacterized protein n=1 Tax=Triplophysa tibetana TaxID=1572043 RepID=A0A5A9PQJ4_9TELE|nr:hypothetical protein E1301_Tti012644 [Triplophysa tibetana]